MCIPILQIGPRGKMQLQTRIARISLIKKWIYNRNFICLQIDLSIKLNFSQFELTRTRNAKRWTRKVSARKQFQNWNVCTKKNPHCWL